MLTLDNLIFIAVAIIVGGIGLVVYFATNKITAAIRSLENTVEYVAKKKP